MDSSLRRALTSTVSFVLIAFSTALRAQSQPSPAPRFPTSDDLRHLKSIGGPQLSPDGAQALFTVTDSTADGAKSHIWVVATSGSEKERQLTFSPPSEKRGERNPQWASDGSAIFFLAHRDENTQLFRLDLRGGEAAPYDLKVVPMVDESKEKNAIPPPGADKKDEKKTDATPTGKPKDDSTKKDEAKKTDATSEPVAIDDSGFALSADGKWIAVWAHDPQTPGEKKQSDAKADASWINHEKHGMRLYLAALKADGAIDGSLKLIAVAPDVRGAVWSQTSDRLLVFTEAPNDLSDLGPAGTAWTVDTATTDKPVKLDAVPATVGGGAWRTEDSGIVFSAATP
jgi:hypothetical protein